LPWRAGILGGVLSSTCLLYLTLTLQTIAPAVPSASPEPPPDRPLHEFFQNLGRDIVALPSRETFALLGAGTGGALAMRPADDNLQIWADGLGESSYTPIGRTAGDGWIQGGAALGTYGIGLLAGNRHVTHLGSDLIRAQALNAVLTRGLKFVADRRRPSGGGESLPSGHASASFATASVLASHYGAKVGVPAYAGAAFIGWTRVRDNAHWLTDVIVGGAIGAAVGRTVTRGHTTLPWTIVPSASSREAAVFIVYTGRSHVTR